MTREKGLNGSKVHAEKAAIDQNIVLINLIPVILLPSNQRKNSLFINNNLSSMNFKKLFVQKIQFSNKFHLRLFFHVIFLSSKSFSYTYLGPLSPHNFCLHLFNHRFFRRQKRPLSDPSIHLSHFMCYPLDILFKA